VSLRIESLEGRTVYNCFVLVVVETRVVSLRGTAVILYKCTKQAV